MSDETRKLVGTDEEVPVGDINFPKDSMEDIDPELRDLVQGEQPVLIRIVEWKEWLPGEPVSLGRQRNPQNGEVKERMLPMHNGFTGFASGKNERLLEVGVQGTGVTRVVKQIGDDGSETEKMYGLYVFQAVLAQNTKGSVIDNLLLAQRPPEEEEPEKSDNSRDKRNDLVIVEDGKERRHTPNRAQRRASGKKPKKS